jgi:hypothetical protein
VVGCGSSSLIFRFDIWWRLIRTSKYLGACLIVNYSGTFTLILVLFPCQFSGKSMLHRYI